MAAQSDVTALLARTLGVNPADTAATASNVRQAGRMSYTGTIRAGASARRTHRDQALQARISLRSFYQSGSYPDSIFNWSNACKFVFSTPSNDLAVSPEPNRFRPANVERQSAKFGNILCLPSQLLGRFVKESRYATCNVHGGLDGNRDPSH